MLLQLNLQKIAFILCILSFTSRPISATIAPDHSTDLYEHMYEVNKEWAKQTIDLAEVCIPTFFKNDTERIQTHLMLVEKYLRAKDIRHLNIEQQQNRIHQLDVLKQYWQASLFPQNTKHQNRQPYFVDDFGTACAVGYLVLESGVSDLVQRIQQENNFAYLRDMNYPELTIWANTNGFTLDELAWIQPGYNTWSFFTVGNNIGSNGTIHAMKASETKLYIAGNFSSFDGIDANSIVAWNGNFYETMEGLSGTVYDLDIYQDQLWAVGDFSIEGSTDKNVAVWDGSEWKGKGTGDMDGPVYDLHIQYYLYIGGDFNMIGGSIVSNIASWNFLQNTWTDFNGSLSVNGPVYCMEATNNAILIGGNYSQVNINATHTPIDANHLAYWSLDNSTWLGSINGPNPPVYALKYHNGNMYIGSDLNQSIGYYFISGGNWLSPPDYSFNPKDDGVIHNFVEHNDRLFMLGGFYTSSHQMNYSYGSGIGVVTSNDLGGYGDINNTVRAAASFQGQLYFAGDFSQISGNSFNQLAILDSPTTISTPESLKKFTMNYFDHTLQMTTSELNNDAYLQLFDMNGRLLKEQEILKGSRVTTISTIHLPIGTYVYHLRYDGKYEVGKFVNF